MCTYKCINTYCRIQNTFTFNNITTTAPPVNVYFANSLWQYAVFHWRINNSEKFSLATNFTEPRWRKCPPTVLGGKCKSVFGWRLCCWAETWERNTNNGLQVIVKFVWLGITRELKYFGWALRLFYQNYISGCDRINAAAGETIITILIINITVMNIKIIFMNILTIVMNIVIIFMNIVIIFMNIVIIFMNIITIEKVRLKEGKTAKITDIPGFLTQCMQSKVKIL